ncbi:anti-sigma factor family protein [Massilia antarctica]|uniref:anti-sigma factor family protein n=1 Tax=Massilia antarctica TaxID=2765360 RepID=UPI0006BB54F3|nr:anti-sigma factor [Massilia sp. H27-R4]MCY0914608.1 anti-sigma factor [Massilia sp. H27-R4]CUI02994.1 Transmembrane regulator protein PrtR [Janthinobacterium sp. CG23_2]CUU26780.1 Transmembrane regulator protein PrtR [Janthinobacterium sp. CG23_2]
MNTLPITEADLHAFVDGKLPAAREAEVKAYLAQRPDEAERLRAYAAQNMELRALFNPVLDEALPSRLIAPQKHPWQWQRLVAGFAIALVSGSAGWLLHGQDADRIQFAQGDAVRAGPARYASGLARQAAIAHVVYSPEVKRPVEIGADQEEQLVAWLSKRLGSSIRPPRLGKLGYELIGGRLLPGAQGAVAQFMYHDATGQRLTLYVSTDQARNKDTGFRFVQEGPVNVFYWIDGKFGYALSAGIQKVELARIATAVYEQLEKPS